MHELSNLPKADIHLHFESMFDPELLYNIASRNSFTPPLSKSEYVNKVKNLNRLTDLFSVLDMNYLIPSTSNDIYELTMKYYEIISKKNIVYIEPAIPIAEFLRVSPVELITGALQAANEAESLYNIKTNFLLQFGRGCPLAKHVQVLEELQNYKHHFSGIGLAGNEKLYPSREYKYLFDLSRDLGYCRNNNSTAHTGEVCPPNSVIETLYFLQPKRLDHAIRAREDKSLLKFLGESHFPIAMCPFSNRKLKVLEDYCDGEYTYHEFIEEGCCVSINSDDPCILGVHQDEVYEDFVKYYRESKPEIIENFAEIVKNGFRMSFMEESDKENWIKQIDREYSKLNYDQAA